MSAPKAFVLHLERAAARAPNVELLRARLRVPSEVLPAVDGARLSHADVAAAYARNRFRPRYPFALTTTEIGAFLSHREAWRRIVEDELDFAAIFEDDAQIDAEQFSALSAFLAAERKAWDYVLMPALPPGPGAPVARSGALTLMRPNAPPLRAIAQIVSRAAAERLLERTRPFDRPVDTFLQMTWVTGQTILVVSPSPVSDVSRETGGTTVQRRSMGFVERIRHEALRPIYRAQVLAKYRRTRVP